MGWGVIMGSLSASGPIRSLLTWQAKAALPWLGIILAGFLASGIGIHLVSLRDSEQVVPIQIGDIVGTVGLMSLLYACGGLLVVSLWRIPDRLGFFTVFFMLRVVMALLLTELFMYDDERVFHIIGLRQIDGLLSSDFGRGYDHIVNVLYTMFGPNILLPKMVNVFLGSLLPFFTYDIARKIFEGSHEVEAQPPVRRTSPTNGGVLGSESEGNGYSVSVGSHRMVYRSASSSHVPNGRFGEFHYGALLVEGNGMGTDCSGGEYNMASLW